MNATTNRVNQQMGEIEGLRHQLAKSKDAILKLRRQEQLLRQARDERIVRVHRLEQPFMTSLMVGMGLAIGGVTMSFATFCFWIIYGLLSLMAL